MIAPETMAMIAGCRYQSDIASYGQTGAPHKRASPFATVLVSEPWKAKTANNSSSLEQAVHR